MPPVSRRRQDAGTVLIAVVISLSAIVGTLLPAMIDALTAGTIPALGTTMSILPTGWAAAAVESAQNGNGPMTLLHWPDCLHWLWRSCAHGRKCCPAAWTERLVHPVEFM